MKKDQICKMRKSSIPLICTHFHCSEKLLSERQWGTVCKYLKKCLYLRNGKYYEPKRYYLLLMTYQKLVTGFHLAP